MVDRARQNRRDVVFVHGDWSHGRKVTVAIYCGNQV